MVPKLAPQSEIIYPESDGQPMADNTKQFRLIVTIKENLDLLFANRADVFIAGDLLWYSVENNNKIRQAPDVMVVFGRPKGDRGSYQQWKEDNIPPQVVFEILSPGNRPQEMTKKFIFYERHGIEEYYIYDPDEAYLEGYQRKGGYLEEIEDMRGWVSPLLGIKFELVGDNLEIYRPDGEKFLTLVELDQLRQQERLAKNQALAEKNQALAEKNQALAEKNQALAQIDRERQEKDQARAEIARLQRLLQDRGLDPNQL